MGRFGSERPERARRTALDTAMMASCWPTTRWPRRSSILTSFWTSASSSRVTGMPVHLATVSAMSSSSTSSFSMRAVLLHLGQAGVLGLELLVELHQRAVAQLGGLLQIAAPLGVGHGRAGGLELLLDLADGHDGALLAPATGP